MNYLELLSDNLLLVVSKYTNRTHPIIRICKRQIALQILYTTCCMYFNFDMDFKISFDENEYLYGHDIYDWNQQRIEVRYFGIGYSSLLRLKPHNTIYICHNYGDKCIVKLKTRI